MLDGGGGSIVATSSVAATHAGLQRTSYGMTKAAIGQLMRTVATQFGKQGILANTVLPGLIMHPGDGSASQGVHAIGLGHSAHSRARRTGVDWVARCVPAERRGPVPPRSGDPTWTEASTSKPHQLGLSFSDPAVQLVTQLPSATAQWHPPEAESRPRSLFTARAQAETNWPWVS